MKHLVVAVALALVLAGCGGTRPVPVPPSPSPPVPTPTPTPTPTPAPTPPPVVCPLTLPLPPGYSLGLRVEHYGTTGQQFDSTPYIQRSHPRTPVPIPPPGWTGECRTSQCDLSSEKDPEHGDACTLELCGPYIDYSILPEDAAIINWRNGYVVKLTTVRVGTLHARCPRSGVSADARIP
jgi:hypothetical protein